MIETEMIDGIINVLTNPSLILETKDSLGLRGITFLGAENRLGIVVTRSGNIVTAYVPKKNYLAKIKREGRLIYEP